MPIVFQCTFARESLSNTHNLLFFASLPCFRFNHFLRSFLLLWYSLLLIEVVSHFFSIFLCAPILLQFFLFLFNVCSNYGHYEIIYFVVVAFDVVVIIFMLVIFPSFRENVDKCNEKKSFLLIKCFSSCNLSLIILTTIILNHSNHRKQSTKYKDKKAT